MFLYARPLLLLVPALIFSTASVRGHSTELPQAGELRSYVGVKRVLVVKSERNDERLAKFSQAWASEPTQAAAAERDLLLMWSRPDEGRAFEILLIGKDGGVKKRWRSPALPEDVFSLIDSMPMRQAEMQAAGALR